MSRARCRGCGRVLRRPLALALAVEPGDRLPPLAIAARVRAALYLARGYCSPGCAATAAVRAAAIALLLVGCGAEVHVEALDAGGDAEVQDGGAAALLVSCDGVAAGGWGYTATLTGDRVTVVCAAGGAVSDASCKLGAPCDCAVGSVRFELAQDGGQWGVIVTSNGAAVTECWR